jgi:hypothetical protein
LKYKIVGLLDFTEDALELDDNLTEEEVEEALYGYMSSFIDWSYWRIEDDNQRS